MPDDSALSAETRGFLLGLLGVAAFGLTLPATRAAVASFHPLFVGTGRAIVAAGLAALVLLVGRHRLPTREESRSLVIVAAGAVVGFPVLTAWAMRYVDAAHGSVMLGMLPLATAAAAVMFSQERPSPAFWLIALLGSALVLAFALFKGGGLLQWADLALIAAVISAAAAYAVGARLAKSLGGLQVISWALVIAAPVLIVPAVVYAPASFDLPLSAWTGFLYVSVISQFLGFLPWYRGLALGGTARVGQAQLLQPFFTLLAAALLLGEVIDATTIIFAVLVFAIVALGRRTNIARKS
jgi:drug/metabolite transporter (DMT)-like permease